MKTVWLKAENDAESEAFHFRVVHFHVEASRMRENNAREAHKAALRDFPDFAWSIVRVPGDRYLVQGAYAT